MQKISRSTMFCCDIDRYSCVNAVNSSLVSTYVVCERLSVMHEPAGVVEILVQILQNTPILKYSFRIPPPPQLKFRQILALWLFSFRIPPPQLKFRQILALWLFSFRIHPPPQKIKIKIFQFQNNWYQWQTMCGKLCVASYHMWRLYPARITTRWYFYRPQTKFGAI